MSNGPTAAELEALKARAKKTVPALQKFREDNKIPLPNDRKPTIGIALSGGGWRAMLSSAAFLDGLSEIGLLDAVSYVAGLSGGSWCVYQLLLSDPQHNPFHGPNKDNPWLAGKRFNKDIHKYEGLIRMLSVQQVDQASHRSNDDNVVVRLFRTLFDSVARDGTIEKVLFNKDMGDGFVERWANFLAEDLLWWKAKPEQGLKTTDIKFPDLSDDPTLTDGTKPLLFCNAIATKLQEEDFDPNNFEPNNVEASNAKKRLYTDGQSSAPSVPATTPWIKEGTKKRLCTDGQSSAPSVPATTPWIKEGTRMLLTANA
jgi:hypothetical protein